MLVPFSNSNANRRDKGFFDSKNVWLIGSSQSGWMLGFKSSKNKYHRDTLADKPTDKAVGSAERVTFVLAIMIDMLCCLGNSKADISRTLEESLG